MRLLELRDDVGRLVGVVDLMIYLDWSVDNAEHAGEGRTVRIVAIPLPSHLRRDVSSHPIDDQQPPIFRNEFPD